MTKKVKKEKFHFTIIELICLVVIVGLLLFMVFNQFLSYFNGLREDKVTELETTINKAAENYFQEHSELLPKNIGDSNNIDVLTLEKEKYLKNDEFEDNSCKKNSYVKIYRLNKSEYTFLTYLYCGEDKVPEVESIPAPDINLSFSDDDGNEIGKNHFDLILNSSFMVDINGGQSIGGTLLPIDYYSFSIRATSMEDGNTNVYQSGILSANRYNHLKFMKKISDYVNTDNIISISVTVRVQNTVGGIREVTISSIKS